MSPQNVYFRNFDQLEQKGQLDEAIVAEFPQAADELNDGVSRRRWLQLMGASIALSSMAGCRFQQEFIAPYSFRPKNRKPGVPVQYATTMEFGGVGRSLLATSFDGRPIKMDGNPDHPVDGSGSDIHVQASVLELYDPDRSRHPVKLDDGQRVETNWHDLEHEVAHWVHGKAGKGLVVLAEPTSSPTFSRLKAAFKKTYPQAKWFEFTSLNDDNERAGTKKAFGKSLKAINGFHQAKVIVSIDSDFLGSDPMAVFNSKLWSEGRDADHQKMSRLYVVESQFSRTGTMADHRIPLKPSRVVSFLAALEEEVDKRLKDNTAAVPAEGEADRNDRVLQAMAHDLVANQGKGCVVVGAAQDADSHARACRINAKLKNIESRVVSYVDALDADRDLLGKQIAEFKAELAGAESLIMFGGNPVYEGPAELGLAKAIGEVDHSIHFSVYENETSRVCKWHGNLNHALESWSDSLAVDGSVCLGQPLIAPLHGGKSMLEVLDWLALGKDPHANEKNGKNHAIAPIQGERKQVVVGESLIQETAKQHIKGDFDKGWKKSVHAGFVVGTESKAVVPQLADLNLSDPVGDWSESWDGSSVEMRFVPCSKVGDGRFANSGWLQELPDAVSKLTWDNAAIVNPNTADKLKLKQNRRANLEVNGHGIQLPVFKVPGVPDGVVVVALGYGRTAAGRVAGDEDKGIGSRGVDAGPLRTLKQWHWADDVEVIGTNTTYILPTTQEHFDMLGEFGQDEVNHRLPYLIREGSNKSYQEFLEHEKDHQEDGKNGHASNNGSSSEKDGSRSEITPVAFKPAAGGEDDHHHGGHHWPEGIHLHFKTEDLGPGYLRSKTPEENGYKDSPKWGMSIDLNDCTGCSACTIACQAENNIPIVGPEQVKKGRELHWMRVDRYFRTNQEESMEHAEAVYQPVTCQHCENAPCEEVCPVAATTHSDEGLNDMVYNRCIGTRYCGNNCQFKVRRFNYLNFSDDVNLTNQFVKLYKGAVELSPADRALQALVRNPDVTVRTRGVMEKCTFCVQRIQNVKIQAQNEKRPIGPNEVKTACQEVCPTNAIKFGDLGNEKSDVAKAHANKRSYVLLEELNNHPRTKYLARVRNPHPALAHEEESAGH